MNKRLTATSSLIQLDVPAPFANPGVAAGDARTRWPVRATHSGVPTTRTAGTAAAVVCSASTAWSLGRRRGVRPAQNHHSPRNPDFKHAQAPAGPPSARPASLASMRKNVPRAWTFRGNAQKRIVLRIAGTGTTHRAGQATRQRARGSRSEPRRYTTPFRRGPGSIHREFSPQASPANVSERVPLLAIGST